MWIDRAAVRELDTPAGREELARRATAAARELLPGTDVEIFWDGLWIRRVGPHYFPDPEMFDAAETKWRRWPALAEKYLRDAGDYWGRALFA